MSGIEVAGLVLGAFPLLISGIEHWRDVATVGGFFAHLRRENKRCRHDVEFQELMYKRNLKELLLPICSDANEITSLIADPDGPKWKEAKYQKGLEARLQESYELYQSTIVRMNDVAEDLRKELCFEEEAVQKKLLPPKTRSSRSPSPQPISKPSRISAAKDAVRERTRYELFRARFSLGKRTRTELFGQLKECNDRLEKLLRSSDRISALQSTVPGDNRQTSMLEATFKKISKKSTRLFEALQTAWQCKCQQYHFANLRLEHRTFEEACFQMILCFVAPPVFGDKPWSYKEISCGNMPGCSFPRKAVNTAKAPPAATALLTTTANPKSSVPVKKGVTFAPTAPRTPQIKVDMHIDHNIQLCQLLGEPKADDCMGLIGHSDSPYHIHWASSDGESDRRASITLERILSDGYKGYISRRQRYTIALLVASSVGQLQSTPWLRSSLCKKDIFFFTDLEDDSGISYDKPFVQQGFAHAQTHLHSTETERNFYPLGVLLLELCFGRRLEDFRSRGKLSDSAANDKLDIVTALEWARSVSGEGGEDYARAVNWCFMGMAKEERNWRGEMIRNVVRPLERCMEHFKTCEQYG